MTVQQAVKMWSRNDGGISTTDGRKYKASFSEAYQVIADPGDTKLDVFQAPGLPLINDLYPGTATVYCTEKSPQQVSPIFWIVGVTYQGEFGPGGPSENPVSQPPDITWSDTETSEEIDEDFDGNPIVTANNEPITGVTANIPDQVLSVRRNFSSINLYGISQYRRSVNSDLFQGWPAGTAKLVGYSAKLVHEFGGYWEVNARFQFREPYRTTPDKAWYARVRHEGFYVRTGETSITRAYDDNKEPTVRPVLLNADGTEKTSGDDANWLEFKRYQPLPYNALGLV